MLLKLITCRVDREHRESFAKGQEQWHHLSGLEGFKGQTGGLSLIYEGECCRPVIVGLWQSEEAYQQFMEATHDQIANSNGQAESCHDLETGLWEGLFDLRVSKPNVAAALPSAGLVRVDQFKVLKGLEDEFKEFLQRAWFARIRSAEGALSAFFGQGVETPARHTRFIVVSMWATQADHDRLMYGAPVVWEYWQGEFEERKEDWAYDVVPVKPEWRVVPD